MSFLSRPKASHRCQCYRRCYHVETTIKPSPLVVAAVKFPSAWIFNNSSKTALYSEIWEHERWEREQGYEVGERDSQHLRVQASDEEAVLQLGTEVEALIPMFEEIRDMNKDTLPEDTSNVILFFKEAL